MKKCNMSRKKTTSKYILLLVISHTAVYGLVGLKQSFYNTLIDALGINDVQLGVLFSLYGVVGMLSYVFGGCVSDLISEKKMMLFALGISLIVNLYAMTIPPYNQLVVIFIVCGITTIFGFYPASNKIMYKLSEENSSGIVFSLYYTFITVSVGITTAIGTVLLRIFTSVEVYRELLLYFVLFHIIAICGIYPQKIDNGNIKKSQDKTVVFSEIPVILKDTRVWLASLIMMANYSLLACLTYINPFLKECYQISENRILEFSIFRLYVLATVLSPIFGWVADRIGSIVKVMGIGFVANIICLFCIILGYSYNFSLSTIAILLTVFSVIVTGEKNIAVAIVSELKIPDERQGTTLGIISLIGFSPDAFFYLLAGHIIRNECAEDYRNLFILGLSFAVCGLTCVAIYLVNIRKNRREKR